MSSTIYLDREDTWPANIVTEISRMLPVLESYEKDRSRVDKLCQNYISVRLNPPQVLHAQERLDFLHVIDDCLKEQSLMGFHCTRLHEAEIGVVKRDGLQPLTAVLARERILRLQESGDLPEHVAPHHLSEKTVNDDHGRHLGMTGFLFSESLLRDEHGVWRLFRNWGGEALYVNYERHPNYESHPNHETDIGFVLQKIGMPCIVVVAVPIAELETPISVAERMVSKVLGHHGIATEHGTHMGAYVLQALGGSKVKRIIPYADPEFALLTGFHGWGRPIA